MVSIQDSVDNCSICQNSRNKKFLMAPQNYNHIFGYIGPASKCNLNDLFNSKDNISSYKHYKKHLKKSTSRRNIYYSKNLDLKKENCEKWIQPGTFLYNVKSHKYDNTKMRYDESDTDFEDLKKTIPRSTKITHKNKNNGKIKEGSSRKKIRSNVSYNSGNMYEKSSSTTVNCSANDSILQNKSKKKARRTDSKDMHPFKLVKNNNCKIMKNEIKNKSPAVIDSNVSIDSTSKLNRTRKNIRNTSTSSRKMNLKSYVYNLCGSIESIKKTKHKRRHNVSKPIDPKIIRGYIKTNIKKLAAAFSNSDFSLNSRDDCNKKKKKKVAKKKISDSSTDDTDLNMKSKLKHDCFGSIDSTKYTRTKGKKKTYTVDTEDEMYDKNPWPQMSRKKGTKEKDPSTKKKQKKVSSKCSICMDLQKAHYNNKHY